MNHALVLSIFSSAFLVLTTLSGASGDPKDQVSTGDQDISDFQQRNDFIPGYLEEGKRSWKDLQTGAWGKRGWKDLKTGAWGKRGWSDLQAGGWGKRSWDSRGVEGPESFYNKRAWNDLRGGSWGKRDMDPYQGYWDADIDEIEDRGLSRRDPGWQQLRGLWGKKTDSQLRHFNRHWGG